MNYEVSTLPQFERQAKQLLKKYPSIKSELGALIDSLANEPKQGQALGNNFYKVRLAIASKGKGKSGGARVITYVKIIAATVYLSYIYDKSDKEAITSKELEALFKLIP